VAAHNFSRHLNQRNLASRRKKALGAAHEMPGSRARVVIAARTLCSPDASRFRISPPRNHSGQCDGKRSRHKTMGAIFSYFDIGAQQTGAGSADAPRRRSGAYPAPRPDHRRPSLYIPRPDGRFRGHRQFALPAGGDGSRRPLEVELHSARYSGSPRGTDRDWTRHLTKGCGFFSFTLLATTRGRKL
jgi:hypothetical protein